MTPSAKLKLNGVRHAFNLDTADAKMFTVCLSNSVNTQSFGNLIPKNRYFRI